MDKPHGRAEAESYRRRVMAMYERSWSAQQKARASGASDLVFAEFARGVASPFGVHTETQSASDAGLWHRDRLRDMRKLPQIGDVHRYATGERRKVLFVVFERNRLQVPDGLRNGPDLGRRPRQVSLAPPSPRFLRKIFSGLEIGVDLWMRLH